MPASRAISSVCRGELRPRFVVGCQCFAFLSQARLWREMPTLADQVRGSICQLLFAMGAMRTFPDRTRSELERSNVLLACNRVFLDALWLRSRPNFYSRLILILKSLFSAKRLTASGVSQGLAPAVSKAQGSRVRYCRGVALGRLCAMTTCWT